MKPVILNYYLTYRCNARCVFCTIWRETDIPLQAEAPAETVCANLGDARDSGVRVVDFTGGEPLLYSDLPVVLSHAKALGLRTTVTSNGILYPRSADELRGLVDILQFSLQAPEKAVHDTVTGTPTFDAVMTSIEAARHIGERPTLIHTVTDGNIDRLDGMTAFAETHRIPLFLNPCFSYPGTTGISRETALRLLAFPRNRWTTLDRGFLKFYIDGGNDRTSPLCRAASSAIVISPANTLILPCYHYGVTELPLDDGLAAALASPGRSRAIEMEGRHPECAGCTVYCYMRASIYRTLTRYTVPSLLSGLEYLATLRRADKADGSP